MLKILVYHKITAVQNFERQLLYLKEKYSVVSMEDLQKFIFDSGKLPRNPLLITFDDADESVYVNAYASLKKLGVPTTVFAVTELIDTQKPFWWDEIEYYLGKEEGNKKVWEVKKWKNKERVDYLTRLREDSQKPPLKYPQLTTSELLEMRDAGITIANHSHTHPMFDQCTEGELDVELSKSIEKLDGLGFTPNVFAYPNGNFSPLSEQKLKEHDIKSAFLFDHKINKGEINPLRISRLAVNDSTPMWKFKFILSGWHTRILSFTRFASRIKADLMK